LSTAIPYRHAVRSWPAAFIYAHSLAFAPGIIDRENFCNKNPFVTRCYMLADL
jgi:hypothetical protein